MGLIDILNKNNLEYAELTKLLYDLNDLNKFDVNTLVDGLDQIYDEAIRYETINWLKSKKEQGDFDGQIENEIDFDRLTMDQIFDYYDNWVVPSRKKQDEENKRISK